MRTCWHADPANRPTLSDIVPTISQLQASLDHSPAVLSSTPIPSAKPVMSQVPTKRQHMQNSGKPVSEPHQRTLPRIAVEQSKQGVLACKDDIQLPVQLNLAEDMTSKPVHKPPSVSTVRDDSNNHTGAHPASRKPPAIKYHPPQGHGGLAVRYSRKALPYSHSDRKYINIPTVTFVRGKFPVPSRQVSTPKPEVGSEEKTKRGIMTPHSSEHSLQNTPIVPPKLGVIAAAVAGKPKRGTTAPHHRETRSDDRGGKLLRHTQEVANATNKPSGPLELLTKNDNYESISRDPYESITSPYESITASPYDMIVPSTASSLPLAKHDDDDREEDENTIGLNDGAPNDPVQPTDLYNYDTHLTYLCVYITH